MSTSIKRQGLHAMNVEESILTNHLSSEKLQDSSQVQEHQLTFQSQSLRVPNVGTLTENLSQRRFNLLTDSYPGLHNYDMEDSE